MHSRMGCRDSLSDVLMKALSVFLLLETAFAFRRVWNPSGSFAASGIHSPQKTALLLSRMSAANGMQGKKVVVVGGSIGGLAAAASLHQIAQVSDITVCESDSEKTWFECSTGAGLGVLPNCFGALERINETMAKTFMAKCSTVIRTMSDTGQGPQEESVVGNTRMTFGQWKVLRQSLADLLPDGMVQHSMTLTDIEEFDDGVIAVFNHGAQRLHADMLVVADGVSSQTRELLGLRRIQPITATDRRTSCRAVLPFRTEQLLPAETSYWSWQQDRGQRAAIFPAGEGFTYWSATKVDSDDGTQHYVQQSAEHVKQQLLSDYADRPLLCEVVAATPPESIVVRRLATYEPELSFGRGRVALLGDAAHPLDPALGQGAAMALEDAVQLALCCAAVAPEQAGPSAVEFLVERYGAVREERVATMQQSSAESARGVFAGKGFGGGVALDKDWFFTFQPVDERR